MIRLLIEIFVKVYDDNGLEGCLGAFGIFLFGLIMFGSFFSA